MKVKVKDLRPGDKVSVESMIETLVMNDPDYARFPRKPKDFWTMNFYDYYSYERDIDEEVVLFINHNMESDGYYVSTIVFEDFYKYEEVDDDGNVITCEYPNPIWAFEENHEFEVIERGCDPVPTVTTEEYIKKHGKYNIRREEYEELDV